MIDDLDRSQICDHILRMRPCPSFFDRHQPCKRFHPEFILQNNIMLWTPRTWTCHAYQRRRDVWQKSWTCDIPNCGQLHRQGWEHSEMFAFRSWISSVHPISSGTQSIAWSLTSAARLRYYTPLTSKTSNIALPIGPLSRRKSITSMTGKKKCQRPRPTSEKSHPW